MPTIKLAELRGRIVTLEFHQDTDENAKKLYDELKERLASGEVFKLTLQSRPIPK